MTIHFLSHRSISRAVLFAITAFAMILLACPFPVFALDVLVVKSADHKPYQDVLRGFKDACNCDVRELKLKADEGADKVLQKPSDVVVAIGTTAFKKVRLINSLPVIYTMVMPSETVLSQFSNISGVSMDISPDTYLSAIKNMFPKVKRIGIVYDPVHTAAFVEEASKAARTAGIELVKKQANGPSEVPGLVDALQGKIDVFWMLPDPSVVTTETVDYLLRFSIQNNIPVFSFSKKYVDMGAVAALDMDPYDIGVQAAEIVNQLSVGGTGPIRVYARKSHLTINSKVAAKMGLKINDDQGKKVADGE